MTRTTDAAAVRVFPPAVPLLAILLGAALQHWWPLPLLAGVSPTARYGVGGLVVLGAFLGLGLYAVVLVRRSGQSENPWKPTTMILDRGPFRLTRNPMYLQMVIGCVGFAIILANGWLLLLAPVCGWVLQRFAIRPEEVYLERKFGETYRAYRRRVRRWL